MYEPTVPEGLWQLADWRARLDPDHVVAVDQARRRLTAGALRDTAERVAAGLHVRGIGPGTVVSWQLPNRFESMVLTVALSRLGAVQNPLVPILRQREVSFICASVASSCLIVPGTFRGFDHAGMAHAIADDLRRTGHTMTVLVTDGGLPDGDPASLPPAQAPGDECRWLFSTSGTTSDPKVARHRERSITAAARGMELALDITADDRITFIAPITHVGGIILLATSLRTGCCSIVMETFDPVATIELFRDEGATLVGMGTPMFTAYLAHQRAHPGLAPLFPAARAFISGGAPTPPALHHELVSELGTVGITSGWGLSECPMITWCSVHDDDDVLATTEGRAVPGADVEAVRPDGSVAPPGEEGELRARGEQMMLGYVDASLDADAFDVDGRLCTGDLGTVDERGYVRITGRSKDIIIRNMENISALELEQLLYTHPLVEEVAVLGVPDPRTGERVAAVIVPRGPVGPSLADLREHLRLAGLSDRKFPEVIAFVEAMPRNAMGKLLKHELRPLVTDRTE